MKEQNEEKNLEVLDFLGRAEAFFEKNKKTIITIVGAVVVVALGVWAYVGLYANPRQQQAAEEMFAAEQWYAEGDYEKALEGNDLYAGFLQVIDQYGGTKSANLAKFYAGVCELNLGKFDEAIDHLKGYKGRDTFTGAQAAMLLGDAYAEKDDLAVEIVGQETHGLHHGKQGHGEGQMLALHRGEEGGRGLQISSRESLENVPANSDLVQFGRVFGLTVGGSAQEVDVVGEDVRGHHRIQINDAEHVAIMVEEHVVDLRVAVTDSLGQPSFAVQSLGQTHLVGMSGNEF